MFYSTASRLLSERCLTLIRLNAARLLPSGITSLANRKQLQVSTSWKFYESPPDVCNGAQRRRVLRVGLDVIPAETRQRESDAGYGSMRIETIYLDVRNREEARPRMHHVSGHNCAIYFIIITLASIVIITKCFCAAS